MSPAETATLVADLDRMLAGTDIVALTLRTASGTLTLRRDPADAAAGPKAAPPAATVMVSAICSGVFLARHPLRETPLTTVGQAVGTGIVLGLLRAGSLLVEVPAPGPGTVLEIMAADGEPVGYGSPLFRLRRRDEGEPG